MDFYEIIHNSFEINTVAKLLAKQTSIFFGVPVAEFINQTDAAGFSNLHYIYLSYSEKETFAYNNLPYELLPLKPGTKLVLRKQLANVYSLPAEGSLVLFSYDEVAFKSKALLELENLRETSYILRPSQQVQQGSLLYRYSNIKVIVFSKYYGMFIDVSPFVMDCTTSHASFNGGNFSFSLPPITCTADKSGHINTPSVVLQNVDFWSIEHLLLSSNEPGSVGGQGTFGESSLQRSIFFFQQIITANDLIYITYDQKGFQNADFSFWLDRDIVEQSVFDLVGLVDSVSVNVSEGSLNASIDISGRDMSKVLIEEGSYFFPSQLAFEGFKLPTNSLTTELRIPSGPHSGEIYYFAAQTYKSIEDVMKFVLNSLLKLNPLPDTYFKVGEEQNITSLIKLGIDKQVAKRRVIDSSLASMSGSILNFLQKVCQYPFVELLQDTYQNKHHLIVRVPPITMDLIESNLNGTYVDENGLNASSSIIAVDFVNVLKESLSMNDSEVYTWFQLTPKGLLPSATEELTFAYLPAVGFPEYIKQWGSKPLQTTYNYLNYSYLDEVHAPDRLSLVEEQVYHDFKFMIDGYYYLPFTRSGTLTLNGDKRLKIGNWIYYQATDEIFMIDAISHNYDASTTQRTTTVQVSRGLVRRFIYGVEVEGLGLVTYRKILNTELTIRYKKEKRLVNVPQITTVTDTQETTETLVMANNNFVFSASPQTVQDLKRTYEKFSARRYEDGQNVFADGKHVSQLYSIGYGHQILPSELSKYGPDYVMSVQEAEAIYRVDVGKRESIVNAVFGPAIFQSEFDALFSFVYNVSASSQGLRKKFPIFIRTVKMYLADRTPENSAKVYDNWTEIAVTMNQGGKKVFVPGLATRRLSECRKFLSYVGHNIRKSQPTNNVSQPSVVREEIVDVLDREAVFSQMKVDEKIFDFFLKNKQFHVN